MIAIENKATRQWQLTIWLGGDAHFAGAAPGFLVPIVLSPGCKSENLAAIVKLVLVPVVDHIESRRAGLNQAMEAQVCSHLCVASAGVKRDVCAEVLAVSVAINKHLLALLGPAAEHTISHVLRLVLLPGNLLVKRICALTSGLG